MKNKKIIGLAIVGIICTSSISFANDIKILKKNNIDYIPLKKVIQKAGGNIEISDNTVKINIDGKEVIIEKNSSFAKIDENYYPLDKKEVNGFEIPIDTKPLYEGKEIYVEKDFLKENKLVDYKIEKDNIVVNTQTQEKVQNNNSSDNKEQNTNKNEEENIKNTTQKPETSLKPEKPEISLKPTVPNKPNKPIDNGNTSSGNNNSNTNNGNNNNSNSNEGGNSSNENGSDTNGNDNTKGDTGITGNENNSGNTNSGGDSSEDSSQETTSTQPQLNN